MQYGFRVRWRWTCVASWLSAALLGLSACGGGGGGGGSGGGGASGGGSTVGGPSGGGTAQPSPQPASSAVDPARTFFEVTPVGPVGVTTGVALNDAGQVAGHFVNDSGAGGFLFDPSRAQTIEFRTPNGAPPAVEDLNERGQVVGYINYEGGQQEAFSWTRSGGYVRIAPLSPEVGNSTAHSVNEAGQVVGTLRTPNGERAFLWSREGGVRTDLVPGLTLVRARLINDAGRIAAVALVDGEERAVLVDAANRTARFVAPSSASGGPGGLVVEHQNQGGEIAGLSMNGAIYSQGREGSPVISMGELFNGFDDTYTQALNERGQILISPMSLDRAYQWSQAGGLVELQASRRSFLMFRSLNQDRVSVGVADRENSQRDEDAYAVAWSPASGSVDLNSRMRDAPADLYLRSAQKINAQGQILVFAGSWDPACQCSRGSGTVLLTPLQP